jgi:hypothetical protein
MTAIPPPFHPLDRFAMIEKIRSLLERSPVFREARISGPQTHPEGQVSVDVGFGGGPALFRITAPSPDKAYALLYELARALVETGASPPRQDDN